MSMQVGLRAAAALKPRALGVRTLATSNGKEYLPWETYLRLRNQRRIAGLVSTVPAMILAGAASGSYFLTQELDPSQTIMGIDPLFVHIGATLACTGLGWLIGPSVGTAVWSLMHRSKAAQIAQRDHEFYQHIRRMRVDPTRQVVHNPVPDYYGEKIGSIKQYRQWLRDQVC
ncbi:TIM23 complex component [Malassezia japonica]|uniref:Presequence translocated-associated motor subunit PAM17 n=1 Tax=Malassezia japonica TaxID=223818 RepID=A0AAF0EVI7_9BASI|nr:TIM23 complex component [Malassezia japonica]WFD37675.1 TIM23 complex component [Malassezia japonica]